MTGLSDRTLSVVEDGVRAAQALKSVERPWLACGVSYEDWVQGLLDKLSENLIRWEAGQGIELQVVVEGLKLLVWLNAQKAATNIRALCVQAVGVQEQRQGLTEGERERYRLLLG